MSRVETNCLDKVLSDIELLKEAREILDDVWHELGPYTQALKRDTVNKLHRYYNFDDSE